MNSVFLGVAGDVNDNGYDSGVNPACALNGQNLIVEVHTSQGFGNGLWYWFGQISGSEVTCSSCPGH